MADASKPDEGFVPRAEDLSQFYLSFLYPGPSYDGSPPQTPETTAIQRAHVGYIWRSQQPGGPALAGGPVFPLAPGASGDVPPLGMMILRGGSQEEAERVAAADPGVVAGRFRVVVYRWLVPKGEFGR
jgi:hypothetical protein